MNFRKNALAALLAVLMLALTACHSEKKNFANDVDDVSSQEVQSHSTDTFTFRSTDMDGNAVSFEDYSTAKVIMFNMWEPWCGPCRGELPDLQKLYKKYKSKGLMIVGVFSDKNGLADIVKQNKLQYPMIESCAAFDRFQTGYVPTTFFVDGAGKVLSDEPYVGAKSYEEWESVILSYLK